MIKVASAKGIYEMPEGKIFNADLPFEASSLRGTEKIETDIGADVLKVVKSFNLSSIYRIPLEKDKFLDVVSIFPDNYMLLGEGKLDTKRDENELVYEKNFQLAPLDTYSIGEGISMKSIALSAKEILEDSEILEDLAKSLNKDKEALTVEIKENPEEVIKEAGKALKGRDFRSFFPEIAKEAKEKGIDIKELKVSEPLTVKKVKELGEPLTLNGINICASKNEAVIMFTPERTPFVSSLAMAKMLSKNENFKTLNYLCSIYKPKDVSKTLSKIEEITKKEDVSEKIKNLAAKVIDDLKKTGGVSVKTKSETLEAKKEEMKVLLEKEGVLKSKTLLKKRQDGYFLANTMSNYGMPLDNFTDFDYLVVGRFPKPLLVEGKWEVAVGLKPFCAIKEGNGKKKVVPFDKADNYQMAFDNPIYKVLKKIMDEKTTVGQTRKLMGEGFDFLQGLETIKKNFSKYKNAFMIYGRLIDHIKNKISDVAFKENATMEDVRKTIREDEFLNSYMNAMENFMNDRRYNRVWDITKITENPQEAMAYLVKNKVLSSTKNGFYSLDGEKLKKLKSEIAEKFLNGNEKAVYKLVLSVRNTLNISMKINSLNIDDNLINSVEKTAQYLERYIDFNFDKPPVKPSMDIEKDRSEENEQKQEMPETQEEMKEPEKPVKEKEETAKIKSEEETKVLEVEDEIEEIDSIEDDLDEISDYLEDGNTIEL